MCWFSFSGLHGSENEEDSRGLVTEEDDFTGLTKSSKRQKIGMCGDKCCKQCGCEGGRLTDDSQADVRAAEDEYQPNYRVSKWDELILLFL